MRCAARKAAQQRFCATLVVPKYVRFYEQVLGQRSEIRDQGSEKTAGWNP
jgi:hypothetical protein